MKLLALDIPDDPEHLPEWLEGHLLGTDLREIVTELSILGGPTAGPALTLSQVLGDKSHDVLVLGLRCLPRSQLRQLMQRPQLLLDLQGVVLEQGGEYWLTLPVSEEIAKNSQQTWQRIKEIIREDSMQITAARPIKPDRRPWFWAGAGWLAATAAGIALLFVRTDRVHQLEDRVAQQSAEVDSLRKNLLAQQQVVPADLPDSDVKLFVGTSANPGDLPDDDPPDLPEIH
jgi:hypothetical protein